MTLVSEYVECGDDIPKGQREPGIEPDRVADDFWREAVALKRYRSHPIMLIGDEPQSYPSYCDVAGFARDCDAHNVPGGSAVAAASRPVSTSDTLVAISNARARSFW